MIDMPPVDPVDLHCMTKAIYHEARSENYHAQLAVGFVIMNRVDNPRWPDTVCGVVEEPWQFSFYNEGHYPPMHENDAQEYSEAVAEIVLTSVNPLSSCTLYYHTLDVTPPWDYSELKNIGEYGFHTFYEDNGCLNHPATWSDHYE